MSVLIKDVDTPPRDSIDIPKFKILENTLLRMIT